MSDFAIVSIMEDTYNPIPMGLLPMDTMDTDYTYGPCDSRSI